MKKFKTYLIVVVLFVIAIVATSFVSHQNQSEIDQLRKTEEAANELKLKSKPSKSKSVFEVADSICKEAGVPFELVKEIGNNESGWRYIQNTNGGSDNGDLQVIDPTYWYWYDKLELTGGKTRRNYLKVGIYYLKSLHNKYGSWEKTRFAYGRGSWRDKSTWTNLEKKFMGKIDWTKYDK